MDNEDHRINECIVYKGLNLVGTGRKCDFDMIYSEDKEKMVSVIVIILSMWDLEYGKNTMKAVSALSL